jgi:superfamily II DNA or RNA helicase
MVGEIRPGAVPFPASVYVASLQTLLRRETLPDATMLLWDEAHHVLADEWAALWRSYPDALFMGFTATPMLASGDGLGAAFDSMTVAASKQELRDAGVLVPAEVFAPEDALQSGELAQDPVIAYEKYCPGEQAVLFAPTVNVAIQYACAFRGEGISAAAIWG